MIELERAESVPMESARGHADTLDRWRNPGVRITIDDFGTGYSSLEYLRAIGLAREFGIGLLAGGVETTAQLDFLVNSGCHCVQGFYFSPPVPANEAAKPLQERVLTSSLEHRGGAPPAQSEQSTFSQSEPCGVKK
jgi:EAL domain-containing protein (putative c-di-GMP-specific phosphodiesterase class I)